MIEVEQTYEELATQVGNGILKKIIQKIVNPPNSNDWKTDSLIDWVAKKTTNWNPIRPLLHDHRKTIDRFPWTRFARTHLELQRQKIEVPKEIFRHLKRFSQIKARTSSWRALNEDFTKSTERLSKLTINKNLIVIGIEGIKDPFRASTRDSKLVTIDMPINTNEGEKFNEIKVHGKNVVLMDQHAFDGLDDVGGELHEIKLMKEAKIMAEAMRLEQEKFIEGEMYPWRRSFRQSWRPLKHNHSKDYYNRPFKRVVKMEFPHQLKTAPSTFISKPKQDYKLLPIKERECWKSQMPAIQFILECQLFERMMRKINYLNNPRYSRQPKYFQALEIYRQKDPNKALPYGIEPSTKDTLKYFHLNPPIVIFDGFEPEKTYVAHLYVMNKSPWSQRLRFIKPSSNEFFMSSKEDPFQGKILISGMFCQFDIIYKPKTTIESIDQIEVRSEMDTCFVTLKSINPLPIVVFPPLIDLGYCLTNHVVSRSYTYTCLGAGAHFVMLGFCDDLEWHFMQTKRNQDSHRKDLQDCYIKNNYVLFAPFLAYPREMKLKENETQEIIIIFRPPKVGEFSGVLKIETSTRQHWEIVVKGFGIDLQVTCNKLDGCRWTPREYEPGILFGNCTTGTTFKHSVSIRNNCEIQVRFYWQVSNEAKFAPSRIFLEETQLDFDTKEIYKEFQDEFILHPTFGVIPPLNEINTIISFTPTTFKAYQQIACLYVDTQANQPLTSFDWKNFKNQLFILENEIKNDKNIQDQLYRFTNEENTKVDNMGKIFKILEFPMNGQGIPIDVRCLPPLLNIAGGLTIGIVRNYKIVIWNNSASTIQFSWEQPKIPFKFGVYDNVVHFQPWSGEIQGNENQDISAIVKAKNVGPFDKIYKCNITNPNISSNEGKVSITFQIVGHVRGPIIAMTPGMIDYGLVQINDTHERDLVLTNKSGCQATFKLYTIPDRENAAILMPKDESISLSSYGDALQVFKDGVPLLSSHQQLKDKICHSIDTSKPLSLIKVCRRVWYPPGVPSPEDDWQQKLVFYPSFGILEKNQSCIIRVVLKGTKCGCMRLAIICDVAELSGQTSMAVARAKIDAPRACLLPPMMDLGIQYLYCETKRVVTLKNLRALPACFNWWSQDGIGDHKFVKIYWSQASGKIPPHEELNLTFKFNPQRLGPFECILVCKVWKQQFPLGLLLKAYIVDIRVSFHIFRPKVEEGHRLSTRKTQEERKHGQYSTSGGQHYEMPTLDDHIVPCLDFGRRNVVGRVHALKLLIRNHSPIQANVQVRVINHIIEPKTSLVTDELWMPSALKEQLSTLNSNIQDPFQLALFNKTGHFPLLDRQDDNHFHFFSSMEKSMLWHRVEGAMHKAMIKEGRSIGFLIYPHPMGVLQPWSEWSCEVVCFNTLPGLYKDIIAVKIGHLSPFYFPVEIELVGNPLISRINNLEPCGLQDNKDTPELVLTWNTMPVGNPIVRRTFWIYNSSPFNMVVDWQIMKEVEEKEEEIKKNGEENVEDEQKEIIIKEGKEIINTKEKCKGREERKGGGDRREANMNSDSILPKLPNICRVMLNIEENKKNTLHCLLVPERNGEEWCIRVCFQEHMGIDYQDLVYVTFQDFLEPIDEIPSFHIVPQKQVILGQKSSQFSITFQSLKATNFKVIFIGRTRIHDGQFAKKLAAPKFEFDSILDKIDKKYIYKQPSTKHICKHAVSYFNNCTSQFQSLLVHKTSLGDHVHVEQVNKKNISKKCGMWANFGAKNSKVYRLEHDFVVSDDESSTTKEEIIEERNFPISILDIPDELITDAFIPNKKIDLIRPLRVTVITRFLVPRLYCNVDDVMKFLLYGNISTELRFDKKALFLTNTYLDRILFSVLVPPPFYIMNTLYGIIEPIIESSTIQHFPINLNDPNRELEKSHYNLSTNWSLQLVLQFRPFVDERDWHPKDEVIERNLVISFQDAHEQVITLYGNICFPEVTLQIETLWFGTVVCPDCVLCQDFSISNTSIVPLEWRIVTEQSHEDMVEYAKFDGFINWSHLKDLNKKWPVIWKATPESGKLPGREGCMGETYKQIVTITFSPFEPIPYKEIIWIEVLRGRGCRLSLEGEGIEIAIPTLMCDPSNVAIATISPLKIIKDKGSKRKSSAKK